MANPTKYNFKKRCKYCGSPEAGKYRGNKFRTWETCNDDCKKPVILFDELKIYDTTKHNKKI